MCDHETLTPFVIEFEEIVDRKKSLMTGSGPGGSARKETTRRLGGQTGQPGVSASVDWRCLPLVDRAGRPVGHVTEIEPHRRAVMELPPYSSKPNRAVTAQVSGNLFSSGHQRW